MEAFMGGSPVMTQVYDGVKGANAQMGMSNPMADDELAGMKEQADFMYEAKLSEYGVTLDLKGIKDIDGKDCYAVTLTDAAGDQTTEYYDVESGLKYMTVQSEDTPTGPMVATTTVLEYMEVDGVLFPKMMKQAVGPQAFDITLDKIEVNAKIKDNEFKVD
jgi:zinc protease